MRRNRDEAARFCRDGQKVRRRKVRGRGRADMSALEQTRERPLDAAQAKLVAFVCRDLRADR
ncbi:hypothetical protein SAMN06295912_15711 [Sphingomonas laterariae]|uniref:Uncharacterized protein n=1 Tax=Edaphosphingomonas laterariae TaxID=861865 RepID=A0A239KRB6_9SPHN|nr:hypothetical protein SAMN06295912_15711 [Sphingomonas laterariae]